MSEELLNYLSNTRKARVNLMKEGMKLLTERVRSYHSIPKAKPKSRQRKSRRRLPTAIDQIFTRRKARNYPQTAVKTARSNNKESKSTLRTRFKQNLKLNRDHIDFLKIKYDIYLGNISSSKSNKLV